MNPSHPPSLSSTFNDSDNSSEWHPPSVASIEASDRFSRPNNAPHISTTQERLRLATELGNIGLWDFDLASKEFTCDDTCARIIGTENYRTKASLEDYFLRIHPNDRDVQRKYIREALSNLVPFDSQYRVVRQDGQERWIHCRGNILRDETGHPLRALGVTMDITDRKLIEERSNRDASRIRSILESTSDAVVTIDREWRYTYLNARAQGMLPPEASIGRTVQEVLPGVDSTPFGKTYHKTMTERVPTRCEEYSKILNRRFEVNAYPTDEGISVFFRDTTEQSQEKQTLQLQQQAIESVPVGIAIMHNHNADDHPLAYVNPAFEHITGYAAEELLGRDPMFLVGPGADDTELDRLGDAIRAGESITANLHSYRKDGSEFLSELHLSPVRGQSNEITHFVVIGMDVTERMTAREQLRKQAQEDPLSGLANRSHFLSQLRQAMSSGARIALIYLDVDNLKQVNDRLGHLGGDKLLKTVGSRIGEAIRDADLAARIGGDEFAILVQGSQMPAEIDKLIERLMTVIAAPVCIEGREIFVTVSAGYALAPQDSHDSEDLLRRADAAMYSAKRECKNSYKRYHPSMRAGQSQFLDLASDMRDALRQDQFVLHYQPRFATSTGEIVASEALLRWQHPQRGLLQPGQFIQVAEDSGMIAEIGEWVLHEAVRQLKNWREAGLQLLPISINVSAVQFRNGKFADLLSRTLSKCVELTGVLEIEVTESVLMDESVSPGDIERIRATGVRLAIDDFGTAYSGLSYLQRFRFDTLKIDRSFISQIVERPVAAMICKSIIELARKLDMTTVAEGVEIAQQTELLKSWNCDQLQGFYCGMPMPPTEFAELLRPSAVFPSSKR